jgi:hypothetical protein
VFSGCRRGGSGGDGEGEGGTRHVLAGR